MVNNLTFDDKCKKYIPRIKTLDSDKNGASDSLKKLKKILLDKNKAIKNNLILYYSIEYPMLLFSYSDS